VYDLILFDLDGTLVDSLPDITVALNHALEIHAFPTHSASDIGRMVGDGVHELMTRALPSGNDAMIDSMVRTYRDYYDQHLTDHTRPYARVAETLAALGPRPMAIATNKPGRQARAVVTSLALATYFFSVVGQGDLERRKPDPLIVEALCRRAKISKRRTLFVGDSRVDAATAEAAGVDFCLVNYGYESHEIRDRLRPRHRIDRFEELVEIV
jgi:phosphoglycolate phosphatase